MSLINLDHFRYTKCQKKGESTNGCRSESPDSEKENKTETVVPETPESKRPTRFKRIKGEQFSDSDSDSDLTSRDEVNSVNEVASSKKNLNNSYPLEEFNYGCLKETDRVHSLEDLAKLKDLFPNIDDGKLLEVMKSTSTLDGAVASCLMRFNNEVSDNKRKRKTDGSNNSDSEESVPFQARKKKKTAGNDDHESNVADPSDEWERHETILKRLQKKFPHLDMEELRDVLDQHNWSFNDALGVLKLFSDPVQESATLEARDNANKKDQADSSVDIKMQRKSVKDKSCFKLSNLKNETSNQSLKLQESDLEDEDSVCSEFEKYSDTSDEQNDHEQKAKILKFLQDASLDELSLISRCSVKKAQKIIELRPFKSWEDLFSKFTKANGLNEDIIWGCSDVLKEREVISKLMTRCDKISKKMTEEVNQITMDYSSLGSIKQPALLTEKLQLKPYQLIGLKWLILLHKNQLSGILADEMGLGKTVQAISFLTYLYQKGDKGPHLIVVPSSTLDNWVRELNQWCPSLRVLVYYGSVEDRKYLRHDIMSKAVDFNVVVSTYSLCISSADDRSLFRRLKLHCAIFDEGHMLKNMNSMRYKHLMTMKAEYRLLLTGTPLQNNLLELMSLLNFIMPNTFSSSASEISKMFSMKTSEEQSIFEQERIAHAKQIMKPFILRRVKREVLDQLPAKEEIIKFCPMSKTQDNLYGSIFDQLKKSDKEKQLCNVMMQLRKMANHPLLHRQYYTEDKLNQMSKLMLEEPTHRDANEHLIYEDMQVMSDFELHMLCKKYCSLAFFQLENEKILDSGKFQVLQVLLREFKDRGDRIVLFSQFTMMLDIVEVFLNHLNYRYLRLDGSTPMSERIHLIDEYNTDMNIFIFLLSTKAGGLGINLTSANVVILHDIDSNPYNDKQAEDRCHRVGQTKTVQVMKLISKGTIEDCMLKISQKKLKLEQDMTAAEEGEEGSIPEDMATLLKASLGL
ncbi:SWI/SNF-related matrix-associated actin-dependent regulator of chromatin subfamily A containing DEAD/H box 1A isoform X2 [Polypterus senegalus]|uniref:SWI/SNF-related matrix-associated actin-dependent regulator of chromatin subfamily A containing DEAD/H box 1A isoform X2 n=1 Tax=Polypterus senegalus TaxID=55291 RepID=UPI0019651DBC|nr:SWI/SNF-related matrix-associated actin-dependent regulator of chromatin subfamily A containing DEAD/H box 1A isoform X2 [Polypterus senegalus]